MKETGEKIMSCPTKIHPEMGWLRGTPDWVTVVGKKGVEGKTAGYRQADKWGPPGTDVVPIHHLLQCAWYMALLDYNEWEIALFPLGWTPEEGADKLIHIYPIARDMALEQTLLAKGKFWEEHIKKNAARARWRRFLHRVSQSDTHKTETSASTFVGAISAL